FYKLEVQKPALSRSQRQEPAIWVPVDSARIKGLRPPMTAAEAEEVMKVLASREYFFDIEEPWRTLRVKLEQTIWLEGSMGLAKAFSALFVLKHRQIVSTSEVNRLYEATQRQLLRELSETSGKSMRELEEQIDKMVQKKLTVDQ